MTYTLARNPEFNSVEITFDGKPVEAVRNAIKQLGFRWHKVRKIWYGYTDEKSVQTAIEKAESDDTVSESVETVAKSADPTKELMPIYRKCLEEVWGNNTKMIEYCLNKTAQLVQLENGMIIEIEKRKVEKDFCFGYSYDRTGEDYDRANRMANHAATSEDYFIRENLKEYQETIDEIDSLKDENTYPRPFYYLRNQYIGESENNPLKAFCQCRFGAFIEAMGGSVTVDNIKGKTVTTTNFSCPLEAGVNLYILTDKDLEDIRAGYVRALEQHKKKVERYLKRYGLKKVRTWSYWRDE